MDSAKVKEIVKKLMAVAGDGVATEGEIENAMRLAAKLIDQHHLDENEFKNSGPKEDMTMGRTFATTQTTRHSTWEGTLALAVAKLFGSVSVYKDSTQSPLRINGVAQLESDGSVRYGKQMAFYGPADDAKDAANLFQEWSASISAMGVIRWGGCFRGDGALYCKGFVDALYDKVTKIDSERVLAQAVMPKLLGVNNPGTAITLSNRYITIQKVAKEWLAKEQGVKLSQGARSTGYRSGDYSAYGEGRQHGSAATFTRKENRKMLA